MPSGPVVWEQGLRGMGSRRVLPPPCRGLPRHGGILTREGEQGQVHDMGAAESGLAFLTEGLDRRWSRSGLPEDLRPRVHELGACDATSNVGGNEGAEVFLTPRSILIGPVGGPAGKPCTRCLASRWQRLLPEAERRVLESGVSFEARAVTPHLTDFAVEAVHLLYTEAVSNPRSDALGDETADVLELSLTSRAVRTFPLLPDSGCPHCASPVPVVPEEALPDLRSRPKLHPDIYRLRENADLDTDTAAFVNPVCGVLGSTVHIELASPTMAPAVGNMRITSAGMLLDVGWSGQTHAYETSRLVGIFEGLERHAGTQQRRHRALITASLRELMERGSRVLDPRECGLYDEAFYAEEPGRLSPFTPDLQTRWVWGRSLRDDEPILVPEQLVYYVGDGEPGAFVDECSNGCAVGSTPEEALLYGLLELVERDAFVLAWYAGLALPEIDVASLSSPGTRHMIDRIRLHGYDVRLFDNRVDLPFPVVNAVGVRRDGGLGSLCFAAGSGLDPSSAAHSAVEEIATYLPSLALRTERRRTEIEAMADDHSLVRELKDHPLLFALPRMASRADFLLGERREHRFEDLYREWEQQRPRSEDLLTDLRSCVSVLTDRGFDVIGVDQTSPEQASAGLSNVAVIVPGLATIDFGWAKQRVLTSPRFTELVKRVAGPGTGVPNPVPHPFP